MNIQFIRHDMFRPIIPAITRWYRNYRKGGKMRYRLLLYKEDRPLPNFTSFYVTAVLYNDGQNNLLKHVQVNKVNLHDS